MCDSVAEGQLAHSAGQCDARVRYCGAFYVGDEGDNLWDHSKGDQLWETYIRFS